MSNNYCLSIYHTSWINSIKNYCKNSQKSDRFLQFTSCLVLGDNSSWLITSELANQRSQKALFTCVLYIKMVYVKNLKLNNLLTQISHENWGVGNEIDHSSAFLMPFLQDSKVLDRIKCCNNQFKDFLADCSTIFRLQLLRFFLANRIVIWKWSWGERIKVCMHIVIQKGMHWHRDSWNVMYLQVTMCDSDRNY